MASPHIGRKRKATSSPSQDGYDSDCVLVAANEDEFLGSVKKSLRRASRSPLQEIHPNKRQRIVECVLIPRHEAMELFRTANIASARHQKSTRKVSTTAKVSIPQRSGKNTGRLSVDDSRQVSIDSFWKPAANATPLAVPKSTPRAGPGKQQTLEHEALRADAITAQHDATHKDAASSRPRSRTGRGFARVSYTSLLEDIESDDEVIPKRLLKAQKSRELDDEDYEHDVDLNAPAELDSSSSEAEEMPSESDPEASESDAEVDAISKRKKLSQVKPTKAAKSKAESASHSEMLRLLTRPAGAEKGLNTSLPPLSEVRDMFADETRNALKLGLRKALKHFDGRPLRVATMCSGTESPLLALQMISDALKDSNELALDIDHVFSAEIVAFKQAYIERNFAPPVIFRDITEFLKAFKSTSTPVATTAYGSKVVIPLDVDIVIAGTSCVDYSAQNNKKKGINDGGESGQTWHGALAYCKAARPAIIIFENVTKADWNHMLQYYRDIDYICEGVLVDTKDYYLPHTRQRGYMVCFDRTKLRDEDIAQGQWQKHMENLKRPASSPFSDFMMNTNDVELRNRPQARDDDQQREVDWSACELRHVQYRAKQRLGAARPFTKWQEGGTMVVPENGSKAWFTRQVDRVKDTIEGTHLGVARKTRSDPGYKTIMFNVSQNVDRIPVGGTHSHGIIGCILPTAIPYVTDAARVLTAHECLKLQGIPLDRIMLGGESPAELLDMAGNAMSSTVVGAALLAALMVGYPLISPSRERTTTQKTIEPGHSDLTISYDPDAEEIDYRHKSHKIDMKDLLTRADSSSRKCHCEGRNQLSRKPLQECSSCGHTTCVGCGGNPTHHYLPSLRWSTSSGRTWPSTFENFLKANIPFQVQFHKRPDLRRPQASSTFSKKHINAFVAAAESAFASTFGFEQIQRSYIWRVIYTASAARLELVINGDSVEWQLFAVPDPNLATNDPLRLALARPVARGLVQSALLPAEWQLCMPVEKEEALSIRHSSTEVPSWWARLGLPEDAKHKQPQSLEVSATSDVPTASHRELCGTYVHLPKCGKAAGSLYAKKAEEGARAIYLFLDPTRTGEPEKDEFVFSYDCQHLDYGEQRTVLARVKAPWRPWSFSTSKAGRARIYTDIELLQPPSDIALCSAPDVVRIRRARGFGEDRNLSTCKVAPCLISCTLPDTSQDKPPVGSLLMIGGEKHLVRHAWVFEVMRRNIVHDSWVDVHLQDSADACTNCAPTRPETRFRLEKDGKTIKSYEDPATAGIYERAVKAQGHRMVAAVKYTEHGEVKIDFGVNVVALAHITAARLPPVGRNVKFSWKLETESLTTNYDTPSFILKSVKGIQPTPCSFADDRKLFPEQELALSWMQMQESGVNFQAEEAEESALPRIGWRAEVRATAEVSVRGGICADHPGFGKTMLSLALVQTDDTKKVRGELEERSEARIPSTATLIVCPFTLTDQWLEEIKKCTGSHQGVIVIRQTADLSKFTDAAFEKAKIIVLSRSVLGSDTYAERIAAFAALPGPASKAGRGFTKWLKFANANIAEHLDVLRRSGSSALKAHIKSRYLALLDNDDLTATIPSRRLRGKEYAAANNKSKASHTSKPAPKTIDTTHVEHPIFEKFYFNRVIVDEFHQYEPRELAILASLGADKRWGLSGTPALGDLYDIAQLGTLIGVPLRVGSDVRGIMKAKNSRALRNEMTDFELFDTKASIPSAPMHMRMHAVAQVFLDTFVRRNKADFSKIPLREHLVPAALELEHRVIYTELSQHLNSADMKITRGRSAQTEDRDPRVSGIVASSDSAEEALSRAAAYWQRNEDEFGGCGSGGVDLLLTAREKTVQELLGLLHTAFVEAHTDEPKQFAEWMEAKLVQQGVTDQETTDALLRIAKASGTKGLATSASKAPPKKRQSSPSDEQDDEEVATSSSKATNPKTSRVNVLSRRLLLAIRSLRYTKGVQVLHKHIQKSELLRRCQHPQCEGLKGRDVAVSAFCGHLLCESCYSHLHAADHAQCPASGCEASLLRYNLLWASKMGDLSSSRCTPFGAKLDKAMDLLENIHAQHDQAIMFVQYTEQLLEAESALLDRGVSTFVVNSGESAAAKIKEFTEGNRTVLVLNASDETAVGLNLQNANHVIFLSPLLRDTQYGYDSTWAQTVGRVRRHGQAKTINVYTIFAPHSIDVDILEHRERRTGAIAEWHTTAITTPPAGRMSNIEPPAPERTQMVIEKGRYSLRPQSWLVRCGADNDPEEIARVKGKGRVIGWEDLSSLVKFSGAYAEDDD